ncbi:sulfite exporter TauE/SafE family protein [Streptomyces alkaliphilus]|uniref:sulfite exporter TauE/SafE family protein n=1 Tax=Streptomyces alkaliphilus TaxID=1472722 RepID=UPI002B208FA8|nr:sulfite exporter TauE/SafE family protein [Streptomyces alkaliphilus]
MPASTHPAWQALSAPDSLPLPSLSFLLVVGLAVIIGSVVQSGVGLGLGLIAAPVVAMMDPTLLPGTMLMATLLLPMFTIRAEWRHVDWRGLARVLPARLPGAVAGTWLVAAVAPETLGALVGLTVLLAVVATGWAVRVRITTTSLVTAGIASGVTGTATSIGGPPVALLYQHEPPPRVRGTLGVFFLCGTAMSLGVLALGGQLTGEQVVAGLALVPFVVTGFLIARPLRRRMATAGLRTALLALVSLSGLVLLVRSLW